MCILIYKKSGVDISKEILQECFWNNPDGTGFAYVHTDYAGVSRVKIKKAMTFPKFYKQYQRALKLCPESDFLIHFRVSTLGEVSEYNNHPFMVKGKQLAFAHNGIITPMNSRATGRENDTRAFNRLVLKKLPKGWENNSGIKELVEDYIGYSKIATLDVNNKVTIFNEKKGIWDNDVWYSNDSYDFTTKWWNQQSTWKSRRSPKKPAILGKPKLIGQDNVVRKPFTNVPTADEVEKMLKTNTADDLSNTSSTIMEDEYVFESCAYCDLVFDIDEMELLDVDASINYVCEDCKDSLIERNFFHFHDFVPVSQTFPSN